VGFQALPRKVPQLMREKVEQVAMHPFSSIPNVKKLQGRAGYRLRVGDWSVISGKEFIPSEVVNG